MSDMSLSTTLNKFQQSFGLILPKCTRRKSHVGHHASVSVTTPCGQIMCNVGKQNHPIWCKLNHSQTYMGCYGGLFTVFLHFVPPIIHNDLALAVALKSFQGEHLSCLNLAGKTKKDLW